MGSRIISVHIMRAHINLMAAAIRIGISNSNWSRLLTGHSKGDTERERDRDRDSGNLSAGWLADRQAIDRIVEIANGVKGAINENFRLISVVCVWFVCGA